MTTSISIQPDLSSFCFSSNSSSIVISASLNSIHANSNTGSLSSTEWCNSSGAVVEISLILVSSTGFGVYSVVYGSAVPSISLSSDISNYSITSVNSRSPESLVSGFSVDVFLVAISASLDFLSSG